MLEPKIGGKYRTINSKPVRSAYQNRPFVVYDIDEHFVYIQFLDGRREHRNISTNLFHLRCKPFEWGPIKVINKMKFV